MSSYAPNQHSTPSGRQPLDDSDLPPLFYPNGVPVQVSHRAPSIAFEHKLGTEFGSSTYTQGINKEDEQRAVLEHISTYEAKWKKIAATSAKSLRLKEDFPAPIIDRNMRLELEDITYSSVFAFLGCMARLRLVGSTADERVMLVILKGLAAKEAERWKEECVAGLVERFPSVERKHALRLAERIRKTVLEINTDFSTV